MRAALFLLLLTASGISLFRAGTQRRCDTGTRDGGPGTRSERSRQGNA